MKTYDLDLATRAALEHVRATMRGAIRIARQQARQAGNEVLSSNASHTAIERADNILDNLILHGTLPRSEYTPNQESRS